MGKGGGGKGGGGRGGGKGGKGGSSNPAPPSDGETGTEDRGNLECFSKYKFGDNAKGNEISDGANGFYLEVNCYDAGEQMDGSPEYQTTGCISFSENKYRSGESIEAYTDSDNRCKVWGENKQKYIGVSIRCCKAWKDDMGFKVSGDVVNYKDTDNKYCLTTECDVGTNVGCTGNTGEGGTWSKQQMMGIENNNGQCDMSRHDKPKYLESQPLCATMDNGYKLNCYNALGTAPPNLLKTYSSTARCSAGYAMVDCNSFIYKGIDMCWPNWENYGVSYGGYVEHSAMSGTQCVARGSWMYIRAQARCCAVYNA